MSDAVVRAYVDSLLEGKYARPVIRDNRWEFAAAVDAMVRGGIPQKAAEELTNRVVSRGEDLGRWAEHLIAVRTTGAKVMAP